MTDAICTSPSSIPLLGFSRVSSSFVYLYSSDTEESLPKRYSPEAVKAVSLYSKSFSEARETGSRRSLLFVSNEASLTV